MSFAALKPKWELLCPGYHYWFSKFRLQQFKETLIPSARGDTGVHDLFYNNPIESGHKPIKEIGKKKQANAGEFLLLK